MVAEIAGADQITCHLRSDRRHIQDADLPRLRDAVQTQLNVEIAATEEMIRIAIEVLSPGASGG
jgi:pyridoxine 5-phosphate synthase